jgi:hypothetical protein
MMTRKSSRMRKKEYEDYILFSEGEDDTSQINGSIRQRLVSTNIIKTNEDLE